MAPRAAELSRKHKAAKQKKLLLLLIPVLVAALAIQGPRLVKHFDQAKQATESVQGQVVQGYEELAPNGPPTIEGEAPSATQTPGVEATAVAAVQGLPNTDTPPEAAEGQLISFTRFTARDPFVQLVDDTSTSSETTSGTADTPTASTTTDSGSTSTTTDTSSSGSVGTTTTTTTDSGSSGDTSGSSGTTSTDVSISVNGNVLVVKVGDTFPPNDPAFKLVAVADDIVKIGLAAGSYSNGAQTIDLEVGDSVTLISQPDGERFTIKIVRIG